MEGADEAQGGKGQGLPACTPAKTILEFDTASESAASESTCTEPGADILQQQLFLLPVQTS